MDEINRRLDDHEERLKRVESSTNELTTFREVVNVKLDSIVSSLANLTAAVETLRAKPATLWDKLISGLIGAAAAGVVARLAATAVVDYAVPNKTIVEPEAGSSGRCVVTPAVLKGEAIHDGLRVAHLENPAPCRGGTGRERLPCVVGA